MKLLLSFLLLSVTSSVILHLASRPRPLHFISMVVHRAVLLDFYSRTINLKEVIASCKLSIKSLRRPLKLSAKETACKGFHCLLPFFEYNKLSLLKLVASFIETGIHGRIFFIRVEGRYLQPFHSGIDYSVKASQKFADSLAAPRQKYEDEMKSRLSKSGLKSFSGV
ncbi:Carboxypeptidase SOL1, partial [Cucurbita argyrosperma subsp. sororia]